MTDADTSQLRLLPWRSPEGKPCYLSTGDPNSRLSRLADDMEEEQIECGNVVLEGAQEVLADQAAGEVAVRFALTQAVLSLRDVLLVAHSRGLRLPDTGDR
ncbi:sulfatase [Streptomyces parvus]|uniref:sulfatase n=1 Tax=Streptomyces parvus TaxID=66428 RepID=UPI0033EBAA05